MPAKTAPYGSWQTPLDLNLLFERASSPLYPHYYQGQYYWLEARAREGGRLVLIRLNADGTEGCLTPAGFNIRTRVHEYGGKCFTFANGSIYFSNDHDRRLYVQALGDDSPPRPVSTDTGGASAFSDLRVSPCGRHLLAVMESTGAGNENVNCLVSFDLRRTPGDPRPVAEGADFYSNPVVDEDGNRLAWIQWDHPYMPWDSTQLLIADIVDDDSGLSLRGAKVIAGDSGSSSVCQLGFYDGDLVFAMDHEGDEDSCGDFWNLYQYREDRIERLTCDEQEYGAAHWIFGENRHAALDRNRIVASRTSAAGDELIAIARAGGEQFPLPESGFNSFSQLSEGNGGVLAIASSATEAPQMVRFDSDGCNVIKADAPMLAKAQISTGVPIEYPTRDGQVAHGYYYRPHNTEFEAPADSLPPLLVMVHGGPTSRSSNALDLSRQYWTTAGFAVLDVNHRGSTGYGRRYRQHLLGRWGCVDVDDIVDGIDYLVNQSLVDPAKVLIRGKSAGGYAVLRALTEYPGRFSAGACYYGIGNLATLAAHTHKFESRYTDRLIGEVFTAAAANDEHSEYYRRSPIHFMHRLSSPIILFQGLEDAVVPPRISREVVEVLTSQNVEHDYIEYPGEGHGFRNSATNIDAIKRETQFYRRILGAV